MRPASMSPLSAIAGLPLLARPEHTAWSDAVGMRELPIVILATLASHPARPSILRRYPLAYGALGSKAARGPLTPIYKRNGRSIPAARASAMWKFSLHGRTALFGRS